MTSDGSDERPDPLPEQRAFIERAATGHGILVAGPGTGKTFTLQRMSEYIVEELGHDEESIELVTLTRSMASKLEEKIPYGRVQTLHSFSLRQLNQLGEAGDRRIAGQWEQQELIRRDLRREAEVVFPDATVSLDHIDGFFDKMPAGFREDQEGLEELSPEEQRIERVFNHQRELFRYRLLDEIVLVLVRLLEQGTPLESSPEFVLVDEYQDLTAGELRLLQLLAERFSTRILVCGDDRQSIFGFRNANREAIRRFQEVYDLDEIDFLAQSKRLPGILCAFAEEIASALPDIPGVPRPPIVPWPGREDDGELRLYLAPSPEGEARWVRDEARRLVEEEGFEPWEIMIIVAMYKQPVFSQLNDAEQEVDTLPFHFYEPGSGGFEFGDPDVRLLGAAVRLVQDDQDQLAWRTLVEFTPNLGEARITRLLAADGTTFLANLRELAGSSGAIAVPLEAGERLISTFGGAGRISAQEVVEFLADQLGLDALETGRVQNLVEEFGEELSPDVWDRHLVELEYSEEVSPELCPEGIPVRTIFGAKGLDAPVVFLMNAQEECFSARGDPGEGLRRLYVAATRAEEKLSISASSYLKYRSLGYAMEKERGAIAPNIARAAQSVGVEVLRD